MTPKMAPLYRSATLMALRHLVGAGVFWYVWGAKGFWWGLLYGLFWPVWAGYRLAAHLWGAG